MTVPRQPSAHYQLSGTGIAPCLQLARYCAACKYWHESDFSTWAWWKFTTGLVPRRYRASVAEGFAVLVRYWHSAGIITAYHRRCVER